MKKMKNLMYAAAAAVAAAPVAASALNTVSGNLMGSAQTSNLTAGTNVSTYVNTLMSYIIGLVGVIAILGFLISAVMYFTAAGDEEKITKANSAMTYSIIGVVVALVGFVVLNVVNNFLSTTTI